MDEIPSQPPPEQPSPPDNTATSKPTESGEPKPADSSTPAAQITNQQDDAEQQRIRELQSDLANAAREESPQTTTETQDTEPKSELESQEASFSRLSELVDQVESVKDALHAKVWELCQNVEHWKTNSNLPWKERGEIVSHVFRGLNSQGEIRVYEVDGMAGGIGRHMDGESGLAINEYTEDPQNNAEGFMGKLIGASLVIYHENSNLRAHSPHGVAYAAGEESYSRIIDTDDFKYWPNHFGWVHRPDQRPATESDKRGFTFRWEDGAQIDPISKAKEYLEIISSLGPIGKIIRGRFQPINRG